MNYEKDFVFKNIGDRMKKYKTLLLISLIILIIIVCFNEITHSSILFFLNKKDVEFFKLKYSNTYLAGNLFINKIGTDIDIPEDKTLFLQVELNLSYFPAGTSLTINLNRKLGNGNISRVKSLEFRGKMKKQILNKKIDADIFRNYRNIYTPKEKKHSIRI